MTLKNSVKLQNQLLESVLNNKGISSIALQLMEKINKPVIITDHLGKILVIQSPREFSDSIEHYFNIEADYTGNYFYDDKKQYLYFPVDNDHIYAYLIVTNLGKDEIAETLSYFEAAEYAIKVYFYNLNTVKEVETRYKNEFIHDLLFNNITSMDEVIEKSKMWGWDITKAYFVMILEQDEDEDLDQLYTYLENYLSKLAKGIITCLRNESIILICPVKRENIDESFPKVREKIADFKLKYTSKIATTFSVGLGEIYSSFKDIHKSYQEAKTAIAISRILGERNFVKRFQELGVFRLLYRHDMQVLRDFYLETLGKIIEYDKDNKGDLIQTLEALFDNNMDWKKTAEKLFLHVNTLRYRIRKIEELLRIDLNKLENQSNLFIALKIRALLKNSYLYESM